MDLLSVVLLPFDGTFACCFLTCCGFLTLVYQKGVITPTLVCLHVLWSELQTTFLYFIAGADEEYIYMNKVVVPGKNKDDKGVIFLQYLQLELNLKYTKSIKNISLLTTQSPLVLQSLMIGWLIHPDSSIEFLQKVAGWCSPFSMWFMNIQYTYKTNRLPTSLIFALWICIENDNPLN